jgi:hypothetical protein
MNLAWTVSKQESLFTNVDHQTEQCRVKEPAECSAEEDYQFKNSGSDEGVFMSHLNVPANKLKFSAEEKSMEQDLNYQLERLWKTDFEDCVVDTSVWPSIEDKRALTVMEESLTQVDNHYQVTLPWRHKPPHLPNNKEMAVRRGMMLKKRLL